MARNRSTGSLACGRGSRGRAASLKRLQSMYGDVEKQWTSPGELAKEAVMLEGEIKSW